MGWQMTLKLKQWRSKKTLVPIETKGERTLLFRKKLQTTVFSQILQVEKYLLSPEVHIYREGGGEKGIHIAWQHCRDT
jgi:hypothetical protein